MEAFANPRNIRWCLIETMFRLKFFACLFAALLLLSAAGFSANPGFLPATFGGWQQVPGSVKTGTNAGELDPGNASVLSEYGVQDYESATYTKEGGRQLTIRAIRFNDATGAYGGYTLYSRPGMQTEEFGQLGESANERILELQGNIVVEAKFDKVNAMSAAEMRELASDLPKPLPGGSHLPDLPKWLPQTAFIPHSVKYAVGPKSYDQISSPLPPSAIDFTKSPEVLTAQYKSDEGAAVLTLISYPTPQIAGAQLRNIEQNHAALKAAGAGDFQSKRTGPLVVIVSGDVSSSEAKSLLGSVNYEADVTFNEPTFLGKRNNIGNLIVAAFSLIGIILAVALVFGFAYGGIRVILKKLYPDRFFDRPEDTQVISLNLRGDAPRSR
jgi:hypothetical protein